MKSKLTTWTLWIFAFALLVIAANRAAMASPQDNPSPPQQASAAVAQSSSAPPLSPLELGMMLARGDVEEQIINLVKERGVACRPDDNFIWSLMTLGASPKLVDSVRSTRAFENYPFDPAWSQKLASDAVPVLRAALQRSPANPVLHRLLGFALEEQNQVDQAILEYREALRLAPNDAEAHSLLGLALVRRGEKSAALEAFRQACALDPANAIYKARREVLERELGAPVTPAATSAQSQQQPPQQPQQPQSAAPADPLRTFHSISLTCRTVWMPWDDMQSALERRPEFHFWGLSIQRENQPADVSLEIDRPLFTFDWTYKLIHQASGAVLASGKVEAWDGPTAAPLLADEIVKKISAVRPAALPTPAAPTGPAVSRRAVKYIAGSETIEKDTATRLVIAPNRIYVSGERGTSFLIPPEDVIAVSYSSRIKNPAEDWFKFWEGALTAEPEDPQSAIGQLVFTLAISFTGLLLEQAKTTERFIRIDWMENGVLHNIVLRAKDEDYQPLLAELQTATHKQPKDVDAMVAGLRQELEAERTNRWTIRLDRAVQVGWAKLEPGNYRVILLMRGQTRGEIFFLPEGAESQSILAQAVVEVERQAANAELESLAPSPPPKLFFSERNGITTFSEIRAAGLVLHFTAIPLASPEPSSP